MDPVGFAASAIGVIHATEAVVVAWKKVLEIAPLFAHEEHERYSRSVERLQMAGSLLSAASHNLPVNKLPNGAIQGLQSCQDSLSSTEKLASEIGALLHQPTRKSLSKAQKRLEGLPALVDQFVSSVDMFREFCQESQTRHIIESTQNIRSDLQSLQSDITRLIYDKGVSGEDENVASLRQQLEKIQSHQTTYQFNTTDEYVYTITVVNGAAPAVAQLTLDSGCGDNWVSLPLLKKAGLASMIEDVGDSNPESHCQTFSGHIMTSQGTITLSWVMSHTDNRRTYENTFHVYDQLPVDMVVGREFMGQEYVLVERYALGKIKLGQLPHADILKMQASAKEKGVENSKIADMRRAQDAAKRQARRAHNAASRATTRGANTPAYPSLGLQTPVSRSLRRSSVGTSTGWSTSQAPSDSEAAVESSMGNPAAPLGTRSTANDLVPQPEEPPQESIPTSSN